MALFQGKIQGQRRVHSHCGRVGVRLHDLFGAGRRLDFVAGVRVWQCELSFADSLLLDSRGSMKAGAAFDLLRRGVCPYSSVHDSERPPQLSETDRRPCRRLLGEQPFSARRTQPTSRQRHMRCAIWFRPR